MLSGVLGCSQICSAALRGVEVLSGVLGSCKGCWSALRGVGVLSGVLGCSQSCWVLSGMLRTLRGVQGLSEVSGSQMHQHPGDSEAHLKWGAAQSCPFGGCAFVPGKPHQFPWPQN